MICQYCANGGGICPKGTWCDCQHRNCHSTIVDPSESDSNEINSGPTRYPMAKINRAVRRSKIK